MDALIHLSRDGVRPSLHDVAGRPLIARQLQWLRACRCRRIAVEIDASPEAVELAEWLEGDELGVGVELVLTRAPLGPEAVAERLGWSGPFLALDARVFCSFDPSILVGAPSTVVSLPGGATVRWIVGDGEPGRLELDGVGRLVRSQEEALAVGIAAMTGELYGAAVPWRVPMHGAERAPGVWIARGAHVDEGAELVAPVFVGAGAYVEAGTRLGPGVVVAPQVVVARGTVAARRWLASSPRPSSAGALGRLLALLLLVLSWPWRGGRQALTSVARGERPWVGLREEGALLPVDTRLVAADAGSLERARAAHWYRANRSVGVDLGLLLARPPMLQESV